MADVFRRAKGLAAGLAAGGVLLLAGCGSGGDDKNTTTAAAPTRTTRSAARKPAVPRQRGPAPKRLVVKDLRAGTGRPARTGDQLTVHYVGVLYRGGKQFDASWDRGEPFSFQLGAGMVIPGWDRGLEGMRQGGRRELVIPPRLAYGAQGSPPAIGPSQTLVFVIDLLRVGG